MSEAVSLSNREVCFYHPEQVAVDDCSRCQQPICASCTTTVAGQTVCQTCVAAIRARMEGESLAPVAAPVAAVPLPPPPPSGNVVGGYAAVPRNNEWAAPLEALAVQERVLRGVGAAQIAGAMGLGFLAGVVGTIAWVAFVLTTHFNVSLIAIGLGWLVGKACVLGAGKRGGPVIAGIGAVLTLLFCALVLLPDMIGDGWSIDRAWSIAFGALCMFFGAVQARQVALSAPAYR